MFHRFSLRWQPAGVSLTRDCELAIKQIVTELKGAGPKTRLTSRTDGFRMALGLGP